MHIFKSQVPQTRAKKNHGLCNSPANLGVLLSQENSKTMRAAQESAENAHPTATIQNAHVSNSSVAPRCSANLKEKGKKKQIKKSLYFLTFI